MPFILNSFGWTGGGGGGITPVTGNGTATYLPIWTAATVLGDSIVRQNATNTAVLIGSTFIADNSLTRVGIGLVAAMGATLHVKGSGATSATSSFIVQNSTPTTLFEIKDDGQVSSAYGYWQGANKILYINPNSTTGNLFVGQGAGNGTMTGVGNVGAGFESLLDNTTGSQNVAIGNLSMGNNTTGNTSVAVGSNSLTSNTTGNANNAFGANTLLSNSTGSNNNAFGYGALQNNTGSYNTAFGHASMLSNTTGYLNVAFGYAAMDSCGGSTIYNTAIGVYALRYTTSNFGTALGYNALGNITSGHTNIGIGYRAGELLTDDITPNQTSNSSIYIGYLTKASADGNTNEMVFGYNVAGNGSNTVTLGNTSIVTTVLRGNVGIGITSSLGAKLHIVGAGATDATKSLIINNSGASPLLHVLDNGFVGFGESTPRSTIHNAGSLSETKITTVSTGIHTVLAAEYIFNCTGTCTINLPSTIATNIGIGKVYKIYAAEAVVVTITPDGADTIDGAASATVIGWGMITLRCLSAGNWRVGD